MLFEKDKENPVELDLLYNVKISCENNNKIKYLEKEKMKKIKGEKVVFKYTGCQHIFEPRHIFKNVLFA